ncbi:hypothetical protein AB0M42_14865 [Streptomyces sp. NPDC051784]|uniref:DUF6197 family protein n=1 Tax=Streptomyces sp. NPDC051784 TaxID=3155805 RepID=UPI00342114AC
METAPLTPDQLDSQAARLHDSDAWQHIVAGRPRTARKPAAQASSPLAALLVGTTPDEGQPDGNRTDGGERGRRHPDGEQLDRAPAAHPSDWHDLLSVPVEQLISESLESTPARLPRERPLPGRFGAVLPERLHMWRRIGQPDVRPSVHLGYARLILTEWGWQNTPYRLRNARGARCVCGAMLTAHRLGYGSLETVDRAGAWIMTELRSQGWTDLIGPWNRHPGRTAEDALGLLDATIRRASMAGH